MIVAPENSIVAIIGEQAGISAVHVDGGNAEMKRLEHRREDPIAPIVDTSDLLACRPTFLDA
jgi:hypothetical protein